MATISYNDVAHAIYLSTKDKTGSHQEAALKDSVKFLAKKRMLSKSKEILLNFRKIVNADVGIVEARVTSKHKLDHKTKEELMHILKHRYAHKEIILEERLDDELLGGLKVEVGDELIDLSLRNKINKLQEYLTKTA